MVRAQQTYSRTGPSLVPGTIKPLEGILKTTTQQWSNESVLRFAGGREPVQAMVHAARELVLEAMDEGWSGPPFDPLKLAQMKGIAVSPRADIPDARTLQVGENRFLIEFNPTRPPGRLRYSIAHEIAHTLFPDCGERVRNRARTPFGQGDEWQLEALCNIAAAEILMPVGSMKKAQIDILDIDQIAKSRKEFDVSTEAVLIRLVHLSEEACAVFVASRKDNSPASKYSFDYVIPSRRWKYEITLGTTLPEPSPVAECIAVGYTAKGEAVFADIPEKLRIECIGIPPYPGALFPRVAGLMSSRKRAASAAEIKFLQGNVLQPRGSGPKLITHVVSDATANWGGKGVAIAIKRKWPAAQQEFRNWLGHRRPRLGEVHFCEVEQGFEVATMVCQRGYGPSDTPRIRYAALETALQSVSLRAQKSNATVHMPRIGCGQAGGSWMLVEELINSSLVAADLSVTVYDLPNSIVSSNTAQLSLRPSS
jgi:Zn-dependent peptidase ImmA (M78 family)/O-acetyl-ADP-ribose deacetylase (regulator of RNase III)